ncbi:S-adenosyl-L-methionine-dependent methyltransferase [Pyronema omphalodes]|nr:S-adenosyl-L-methionine-dependent methyltransferase [Pyronema omphalodes]
MPRMVHPTSIYNSPHTPAAVWHSETEVIEDLYSKNHHDSRGEYTIFMLEDFTVYTPQKFDNGKACNNPLEMVTLSALHVMSNTYTPFLVDGSMSYKHPDKQYVHKIKIQGISIDYSEAFTKPKIWLQSCSSTHHKEPVWYELGTPSGNYQHYYEPFIWLVTLGIHFFTYINHPNGPGAQCCLENFRQNFRTWLNNEFENSKRQNGDDQYHESWLAQVDNAEDFRQYISAHSGWLWHELNHISDLGPHCYTIPLWGEIQTMTAIPRSDDMKGKDNVVTTPYVHSIFRNMYGPFLKTVMIPQRMEAVEISARQKPSPRTEDYVPVVGDVVAINIGSGEGRWAREPKPHSVPGISEWGHGYWFGWVKKVSKDTDEVNIIWLYQSEYTIVDPETYPWPNELFFSDHCNCGNDSERLFVTEIAGKVDVVFWPDEENLPKDRYFIRQNFRTKNPAFLTLKRSDLDKIIKAPQKACLGEESPISLHEKIKESYAPGDTILYAPSKGTLLEPAVVVSYNDNNNSIRIRRLLRQITMDPNSRPNEVSLSNTLEDIPSSTVARKCYVQVFGTNSPVRVPYNRDGTGDCFFIRSDQSLSEDLLKVGYTPDEPIPKPLLRGLDLFCGGGNFGRGLEEGGVVKMKWAVDRDSGPLHTYRANMSNANDVRLYLGSVNNFMKSAILGEYSEDIPRPGEVDVISAGSPCQGFSLSNRMRKEEVGLRKSALICSLATAVDVYRPKYVFLENVPAIASDRTRFNGTVENTFATLLSAIVGLGYQCESFICDSWSHGNPQHRSRVIMVMTKRGYTPISRPTRSHEHPVTCRKSWAIGRNGYKFDAREVEGLCPFPPMTFREAFKHLPDIGDGHVMLPIRYPDHSLASRCSSKDRLLMTQIPRHQPDGLNCWRGGVIGGYIFPGLWKKINIENKNCKAWTRIKFDELCPTVMTSQSPQCTRLGKALHPQEARVLSIQELKIAQGFPDDEVLVGTPKLRVHVIGNSVARGVALALGIALREAYLKENRDD